MADTSGNSEEIARLLRHHDQQLEQIAFDLHDGFLQYVIAARMSLEALQSRFDDQASEDRAELAAAIRHLQHAYDEGRQLIEQLHTGRIDSLDLVESLQRLANELTDAAGIDCQAITSDVTVESATAYVLFRIAQESINNIRRHSRATEAQVRIFEREGHVVLVIEDNGCGFNDRQSDEGHFGIAIMRIRAESVGGSLQIESQPGKGTKIRVEVPAPSSS